MIKTGTRILAATMASVFFTGAVHAAQFPDHPIRILVGFGAGGASDIAARVIAAKMSTELGQQIIVENKPGASTSIAGEAVATAKPDGYTLFQAGNANAVNAISKPKPPFDILTAFAPIGVAITTPSVLVAHPSSGITSVKELIATAKEKPGSIMYGSSGAAAVSHLAAEYMAHEEHIKLTHVPYKGSSQAMTDLLAGRFQIMFAPISTALPMIHDHRLVALAVTSDTREKELPDVPTLAETGVNGVDMAIWSGFVAPRGTPPDRIAILGKALQSALKSDDVRNKLAVHGIQTVPGAEADAFNKHMKSDIEKLEKLVKDTGIKLGAE